MTILLFLRILRIEFSETFFVFLSTILVRNSFSIFGMYFSKPISFASGRKGEKDLFYYSINGEMKVKTYTDWGLLESEIVFVNK